MCVFHVKMELVSLSKSLNSNMLNDINQEYDQTIHILSYAVMLVENCIHLLSTDVNLLLIPAVCVLFLFVQESGLQQLGNTT